LARAEENEIPPTARTGRVSKANIEQMFYKIKRIHSGRWADGVDDQNDNRWLYNARRGRREQRIAPGAAEAQRGEAERHLRGDRPAVVAAAKCLLA
jgi:hypothetical protein